ncbi:aminotransferase-like domain-containing protein [Nonomuraea rhodomycinica]|uniref:PLP-dependent aminotransferase family protein n=1 Tax=Nonomuraea rhodomycinica TaxID=1712872 RepID=A0A7Y6MEC5_9ACTN|nr:PLP-dependent aminotransferase family protein [Nonomuraea rhodomycinica]NUW43564.1 PLP-dependent aminotransferase family protein [Nonomuraea rhodomycinica]
MGDLYVPLDHARGGVAAQVASGLRDAVCSGRLAPGDRLPSSRDLAADLGVSRGVVVEAYEQLVAEGFLVSRVGSGTRVAPAATRGRAVTAELPESYCDYQSRATSPDLGHFPRERWLAALRDALAIIPSDALDYGDPAGIPELREELAGYLRRVRAADVDPANLVIVGGVAQGLSLVLHVLAERDSRLRAARRDGGHGTARRDGDPGTARRESGPGAAGRDGRIRPGGRGGRLGLAVEDPTSQRQVPLLRRAGADVLPVPVDGRGLDVAALRDLPARAVLVTPAHQYPTGVVLSPGRRAALVEWAREADAIVLEDDYDAEFRYDRDPVGCLQGLAPDRVVLVGSVSKALAPGLRLGWVVAPPALAGAVRLARGEFDLGSPVIEQYALASFLRTGGYDRHLRRMRREYRGRRDALVRALAEHLPEVRVRGIEAGLHAYLDLPAGWDEERVVAVARELGLAMEAVGPMRFAPGRPAVAVGFSRLPVHRAAEAVRGLKLRMSGGDAG